MTKAPRKGRLKTAENGGLTPEEEKRLAALQEEEAWYQSLPEPSKEEADRIEAAKARRLERIKERPPAPKIDVSRPEDGVLRIRQPHKEGSGWGARVADVMGTTSGPFGDQLIMELANLSSKSEASIDRAVNAGVGFIAGGAPSNEIEGALLAQMYATHSATMVLARQMERCEMRDQYRDYGNLFVKVGRTFAAQVEALAKLRSGGKQQVEVRYVYVDARTQTLVNQAGGPGGAAENIPQSLAGSQAALAFAPGAPVWSPDALGEPVPHGTSEGKAALPDARGNEPRRADRPG